MKIRFVSRALLVALLAALPAHAAKITLSETSALNVGVLLQPQAQSVRRGAVDGERWSTDFYLRRARLMIYGSLNERISFFAETDTPNFGKDGNYDVQFFIQDAFVSFKVMDELTVDTGMILLPLSRHSLQGATSLLGLDYYSGVLLYPPGSNKVLRDIGVQLRGMLGGGKVHYRVGVFNGVEGLRRVDAAGNPQPVLNPSDWPRITAHARYNFLGKEEAFFFSGIAFAKEPVISVGLGADYQSRAVASINGTTDYRALSADVFVDWPLSEEQEVVFQTNLFRYDQGEDGAATGTGGFVEAGFRWNKVGLVAGTEVFNSTRPASDRFLIRGGVNYWLEKHQASVKLDLSSLKVGDTPSVLGLTAQTQIFF
ncbi:MAG: hypothetical protein JXB05_26210 [Myxococcaceae bacterium]|nr:hypothetical protein [Myxococcaceae bacterium]